MTQATDREALTMTSGERMHGRRSTRTVEVSVVELFAVSVITLSAVSVAEPSAVSVTELSAEVELPVEDMVSSSLLARRAGMKNFPRPIPRSPEIPVRVAHQSCFYNAVVFYLRITH